MNVGIYVRNRACGPIIPGKGRGDGVKDHGRGQDKGSNDGTHGDRG